MMVLPEPVARESSTRAGFALGLALEDLLERGANGGVLVVAGFGIGRAVRLEEQRGGRIVELDAGVAVVAVGQPLVIGKVGEAETAPSVRR